MPREFLAKRHWLKVIKNCLLCGNSFEDRTISHNTKCCLNCRKKYYYNLTTRWLKIHPEKKKGYDTKYYLKHRNIKWERNIGRKTPEETKEKLSEALKIYWERAIRRRKKMSENKSGANSPFWKGGKTKQCLYKHITDSKWKIWRKKVFQRDNWICQKCETKSKEKNPIYLMAHHIKGWTEYPKLRYQIPNGITLCRKCHFLTHKIYERSSH